MFNRKHIFSISCLIEYEFIDCFQLSIDLQSIAPLG